MSVINKTPYRYPRGYWKMRRRSTWMLIPCCTLVVETSWSPSDGNFAWRFLAWLMSSMVALATPLSWENHYQRCWRIESQGNDRIQVVADINGRSNHHPNRGWNDYWGENALHGAAVQTLRSPDRYDGSYCSPACKLKMQKWNLRVLNLLIPAIQFADLERCLMPKVLLRFMGI